ncbi:hypothetical protein BY458DRAFT_533167 [Sporodiniella umbellata]|nr:hypothetical protein BY458DRAFT_533167 [Sporodiniella umbellata]
MFSELLESIQSMSQMLFTMKRLLSADKSSRDVFRQESGFVTLISMIVALEGAFKELEPYTLNSEGSKSLLVLQTVFSVLADAMYQHKANRLYFEKDVGYETVENAILLTEGLSQRGVATRIFGMLFCFALENEALKDLFTPLSKDTSNSHCKHAALTEEHRVHIVSTLNLSTNILINPGIMLVILHLQSTLASDAQLSQSILYALSVVSKDNRGNQMKLNKNGMLLSLYQRLLDAISQKDEMNKSDQAIVNIMKHLTTMGIDAEELRFLLREVNKQEKTTGLLLDLLLHGTVSCQWPRFIQFGHPDTYFDIPQLVNFPPSNPGYTLLFWIHIEQEVDENGPSLSLFHVWDDQEQLFRVFIDTESKLLFVQSNYSKQPIIFKQFKFDLGQWYHLVLVHNKSRLSSRLSSLSLYNALEKETIKMIHSLGPRYDALFQDTLKPFQTHRATMALFLDLREGLKGTRQDEQLMAGIVSGSLFQAIPEDKITFAFFANNVLSEKINTGFLSTGMSMATCQALEAEENNYRMILNSALPKLDLSISRPRSMGYFVGEPVVAHPLALDESIWKLGGCSVIMKLIELSKTTESLCKTVAFLFEILNHSWRISIDMERSRGYELLAYLLKRKRNLITLELFELILSFIGKNKNNLGDSIINNPLAYRYIILNFEVWKKTNLDVQKAHLEQFVLFTNISNFRSFNLKQLPEIHIVKKFLLALRMNTYSTELGPYTLDALKAIMLINWDTEGIRAVATFLASTVSQVYIKCVDHKR